MDAPKVPPWRLADRLVRARGAARLHQGDVAAHLGLARGTISQYESGYPIKLAYVRLWAELCHVPLDWLLYGDGSINEPAPRAAPGDLLPTTSGWFQVQDRRDGLFLPIAV